MRQYIDIVSEENSQLDERSLSNRTVKIRYVVESYNKTTGEVISSKDCEDNKDFAWEVGHSFKRLAHAHIGVRVVEFQTVSVTERKVRNF
jgi:hypothetical protein